MARIDHDPHSLDRHAGGDLSDATAGRPHRVARAGHLEYLNRDSQRGHHGRRRTV